MLVHRPWVEDISTHTPTRSYELVLESNYSFWSTRTASERWEIWVMRCLPLCRDDMKKLTTSTLLLERWPSCWIMCHVFYTFRLKGRCLVTEQRSPMTRMSSWWQSYLVFPSILRSARQFDAYITIPWLEYLCEKHLNAATNLKNVVGREDEINNRRKQCVKALLLYQVECKIFIDKSNKQIVMIFREAPQDLDQLYEWSWGGMTLSFLYHYLPQATTFKITSIGENKTLL